MLLQRLIKLKISHSLNNLPTWLVVAALFALIGCDQRSRDPNQPAPASTSAPWERHMQSAWDEAQRAVDGLTPLKDKVTTTTKEEFEKLFIIEYKAVEVNKIENTPYLEAVLSQLGKDRWDCFHVSDAGETWRLMCKRRPESWVRHVGRLAPFIPMP